MKEVKRVSVLGGGPAGLWAAMHLLRRYPGLGVTVLERQERVGGIASSFRREGLIWDMGSHRLHPAASPEVMEEVRGLLGEDLLTMPRNGRIYLEGRFVKFPLRPMDAALRLPMSFKLGVGRDTVLSPLRGRAPEGSSFRRVLERGLGRTICERFYFPYAEKLWGVPVDRLDGEQARRRVSAGTIGSMFRKLFSRKSIEGSGKYFHYPRGGFGRIFEAAAEEVEELGGRVLLGTEVTGASAVSEDAPWSVSCESDGEELRLEADFVFSTLPVTALAGILRPEPPQKVKEASDGLSYRSMVLLFLKLDMKRYTPYDAHYFPGRETTFSRLSERSNYQDDTGRPDSTGLCLEVPCWNSDEVWDMEPEELTELLVEEMVATGLPEPAVSACFKRRIEHAYPSYAEGWREYYGLLDSWLEGVDGLVSFGRQGLFAHDNTHHAMEMGARAASCLHPETGWDRKEWASARESFRSHRVED